jgi:hypothetical protein
MVKDKKIKRNTYDVMVMELLEAVHEILIKQDWCYCKAKLNQN